LKAPVVLVDAENVRRSRWPNIAPDALVGLVDDWADREQVNAVVVFDGRAPDGGSDRVEVVGTRGETADDWIARAAAACAAEGRPYRLVTSDRGLRARAGGAAAAVVGGGTFAGELVRATHA
jgi:hypothetical protein